MINDSFAIEVIKYLWLSCVCGDYSVSRTFIDTNYLILMTVFINRICLQWLHQLWEKIFVKRWKYLKSGRRIVPLVQWSRFNYRIFLIRIWLFRMQDIVLASDYVVMKVDTWEYSSMYLSQKSVFGRNWTFSRKKGTQRKTTATFSWWKQNRNLQHWH